MNSFSTFFSYASELSLTILKSSQGLARPWPAGLAMAKHATGPLTLITMRGNHHATSPRPSLVKAALSAPELPKRDSRQRSTSISCRRSARASASAAR
jgi:hypothetical protein